MIRSGLATSIQMERGTDMTRKFKEIVSSDETELYKFQRFMYHIFYDPETHTHLSKEAGQSDKKRVYWSGSREYHGPCIVEDYDNKKSNLYTTLHMFKNHEKYYEFFKYMLDTCIDKSRKRATKDLKLDYSMSTNNSNKADIYTSYMYYVTIGGTYIELEFNNTFHKSYKVFASYRYGMSEE